MKNKINWNKVGWRTLQFLVLLIINAATIAFIVLHMIDFGDSGLSYWLVMSNNISKNPAFSEVLDKFHYVYHWYNKFLVYLFMLIGWLMSYGFIKLLYKNHREDKQNKLQNENQEKQNKALLDSVQKIMEGKKK